MYTFIMQQMSLDYQLVLQMHGHGHVFKDLVSKFGYFYECTVNNVHVQQA